MFNDPVKPGKETITILKLHIISRVKGNQTIKFDHLIEYNTRNVFLKKIIHKMW